MASQLLSRWRPALYLLTAVVAAVWLTTVHAAIFGGSSVQEGIQQAAGLGGISSSTDIRTLVVMVINAILLVVLIIAVLVIVIAGIYLIVSNGDEGSKDKAKKIILYCVVGIVVILLARSIVTYVNEFFD